MLSKVARRQLQLICTRKRAVIAWDCVSEQNSTNTACSHEIARKKKPVPGNSPAGRAPTRSRFQSHKSRRATELGGRLSLASQPRSSSICCRGIGILSNRIHIGQPFFLGPVPIQTRCNHETFDVRSSLAQLRTNDDFSP